MLFKLVEWAIVISNICNICTEIPFVCFILFTPVSSSDPVNTCLQFTEYWLWTVIIAN